VTAHEYFRAFEGRGNQANSVERFEALGIVLYRAADPIGYRYYAAGHPATPEPLTAFFDRLLRRVAERNPDRFRYADRKLSARRLPSVPDLPEEDA
jgi:hypothetical protein